MILLWSGYFLLQVVRAQVPRMTLDELFEQKGDVAKAVLEELEKVLFITAVKVSYLPFPFIMIYMICILLLLVACNLYQSYTWLCICFVVSWMNTIIVFSNLFFWKCYKKTSKCIIKLWGKLLFLCYSLTLWDCLARIPFWASTWLYLSQALFLIKLISCHPSITPHFLGNL